MWIPLYFCPELFICLQNFFFGPHLVPKSGESMGAPPPAPLPDITRANPLLGGQNRLQGAAGGAGTLLIQQQSPNYGSITLPLTCVLSGCCLPLPFRRRGHWTNPSPESSGLFVWLTARVFCWFFVLKKFFRKYLVFFLI